MKSPKYLAIILSLLMVAMLSACGAPASSSSSQEAPSPVSSTVLPADTGKDENGTNVYVTDIEGNTQNLADFAWAKKYSTLLDWYAAQNEENLKDFVFNTVADENLIPYGNVYEYDIFGQTMSIAVQNVERGTDVSCIPADKVAQGERLLGAPADGQEYLAVTMSLTNNGSSSLNLTLNSVSLRCAVDGQEAGGPIGSEAITSDLPFLPDDYAEQFHLTLEGGETQVYSILYYVNSQLETCDLYLYPNFAGYGYTEIKTAFNPIAEQWLALE